MPWLPDAELTWRSFGMTLSLEPLGASISVSTEAGINLMYYGASQTNPGPGVQRRTIITGDALLTVGELLADTEKQLAVSSTPTRA